MGDFKITVVNKTGQGAGEGRSVNVMFFQIEPDPLTTESFSSAWRVIDIGYPGKAGPVDLPQKVQFYVIDKVEHTPRESGPFDVKFGSEINVFQKLADDAPTIEFVTGQPIPKGEIKVNNASGNAKALEMALFKNGKKLLCMKDVSPANSISLAVKPVIYVANVDKIVEGEDFKATEQATKSTPFNLFPNKPNLDIQINELPSGEIIFSEM